MKDRKAFFDTNILVYAYDVSAGAKREKALKLLEMAWNKPEKAAISAQVLQEFYVTLVKRGLDTYEALRIVEDYAQWEVVTNDALLTLQAIKNSLRFRISFWDGLIIAAADKAGADIVYSEDLNHSQKYSGLAVINPFA